MAFFAPVNGDAQPVFALDTRNGPIAASTSTTGQPVQPAGPKLDFYRVAANTSLAGQSGVQEYVANVIQAVQQTATVAMYQVDAAAISFAIYPTGAFGNSAANPPTTTDTAIFLAAANVAGTGFQLDTCQSLGFKLAAS
jgi:hypothetical protein